MVNTKSKEMGMKAEYFKGIKKENIDNLLNMANSIYSDSINHSLGGESDKISSCVLELLHNTDYKTPAKTRQLQIEKQQQNKILLMRLKCVYFIACPLTCLIKIGQTNHINNRLQSLASLSPTELALMHCVVYKANLEEKLHRKFKEIRHHGEWFEATDELISFIREVKTKGTSFIEESIYQQEY